MKQSIRIETFETNSSSYHTLSIRKTSDMPKPIEIEKGKDLTIGTKIRKHYIGDTSSYINVSKGSYAKAQSVLRFMGYELEDQLGKLIEDSEWKVETYPGSNQYSYEWEIRYKLYRERFYNAPLIQAFVKAIKRHIGEEFNVNIELEECGDVIHVVSDDGCSTSDVFGVKDLTDVDKLADRFYDIIFNEDIEMVEECESNE